MLLGTENTGEAEEHHYLYTGEAEEHHNYNYTGQAEVHHMQDKYKMHHIPGSTSAPCTVLQSQVYHVGQIDR